METEANTRHNLKTSYKIVVIELQLSKYTQWYTYIEVSDKYAAEVWQESRTIDTHKNDYQTPIRSRKRWPDNKKNTDVTHIKKWLDKYKTQESYKSNQETGRSHHVPSGAEAS